MPPDKDKEQLDRIEAGVIANQNEITVQWRMMGQLVKALGINSQEIDELEKAIRSNDPAELATLVAAIKKRAADIRGLSKPT